MTQDQLDQALRLAEQPWHTAQEVGVTIRALVAEIERLKGLMPPELPAALEMVPFEGADLAASEPAVAYDPPSAEAVHGMTDKEFARYISDEESTR